MRQYHLWRVRNCPDSLQNQYSSAYRHASGHIETSIDKFFSRSEASMSLLQRLAWGPAATTIIFFRPFLHAHSAACSAILRVGDLSSPSAYSTLKLNANVIPRWEKIIAFFRREISSAIFLKIAFGPIFPGMPKRKRATPILWVFN